MSSALAVPEPRVHSQHLAEYTRHLANYTQRQFKVALASLDSEKIAGLSKIPSAHSCVSERAAQNSTKNSDVGLKAESFYLDTSDTHVHLRTQPLERS